MVNVNDLEDWSVRVAEALQEICDNAQVNAGNPDGDDQCPDIRELLDEHTRIMNGQPL
jgi:hypothetical protein